MPNVSKVVDVQISQSTTPLSKKSFSKVLVVGPNGSAIGTTERVREYSSAAEMISADFESSDAEYLFALDFFGQTPTPQSLLVGYYESGTDTNGYEDALAEIALVRNDFYGVAITDRTSDEQSAAATWASGNKKMFLCSSADSDILSTGETTSIAYSLNNSNEDRAAVIYSPDAASEFHDAAFLGLALTRNPGSYAMKFKTLKSVSSYELTSTQRTAALGKKCNLFEKYGSRAMIAEGTVASGEFFDTIVGIDWLEARIAEEVFAALSSAEKVQYTEAGIVVVAAAIAKVLDIAIEYGLVSEEDYDDDGNQVGGYVIETPDISAISAMDKNNRTLPNVKFTAYLAGAIHKVVISGSLV